MSAEKELLELGTEIIELFAGDLRDGEVDPESIEKAARVMLDAGLEALPEHVFVKGFKIPLDPESKAGGVLIGKVLVPLIETGIKALIELTKPTRAVVHAEAGSEVTMTVRD